MLICEKLINKTEKMSVIGLGYVGMPIALAFAKHIDVIGFDVDQEKIDMYCSGIDPTDEVGAEELKNTTMKFTTDEHQLKEAKFHIVAVPTPINENNTPDLKLIESASALIGRHLTKGGYVVFESTVYPGVTEDICIPILEKESGLTCGTDFKVGYSPERINPGDKVHTLDKIIKIVSGIDEESRDEIAKVYEIVVTAGTYKAGSIKVAEAAKVIENSQRDVNIAFMNEVAMVFDKIDLDTNDVIEAMNTKWNALGFYPGLVGGHCISVDPYYFTHLATKLGYNTRIISTGRQVNESVSEFIAEAIVKELILTDKIVSKSKIAVLGITFKENCPDIRNSKTIDMIKRLQKYGIDPIIVDPVADIEEVHEEYGIQLADISQVADMDCIIFSVAHDDFSKMTLPEIDALFKKSDPNSCKIIIDIKSMLDKDELEAKDYQYWNL